MCLIKKRQVHRPYSFSSQRIAHREKLGNGENLVSEWDSCERIPDAKIFSSFIDGCGPTLFQLQVGKWRCYLYDGCGSADMVLNFSLKIEFFSFILQVFLRIRKIFASSSSQSATNLSFLLNFGFAIKGSLIIRSFLMLKP